MKNIVFFIVPFLLIMGCSKDNTDDKSIIGKWKMVELCLSDGGTTTCNEIENGLIYYFKNNGTFTSIELGSNCTNGTYTYNTTDIFLEYNDENCSLTGDLYILDFNFINEKLKLAASIENQFCEEACYGFYNRIP